MPARAASDRIFCSSTLSCIGSNLLNSGAIQIGATRLATTMNGTSAMAVYSHQRRGLFRSSRYGTHITSAPTLHATASHLTVSPYHLPIGWFDRPFACSRTTLV